VPFFGCILQFYANLLIPTKRSSIEIANSLESQLVNTYPQF